MILNKIIKNIKMRCDHSEKKANLKEAYIQPRGNVKADNFERSDKKSSK